MHTNQEDMQELRRQLEKGSIQRAYRALLAYMLVLRTHFANEYPGLAVSGLYQGYMDMTYFALVTPLLKQHGLKIAIVFNFTAFRFEAWLAGRDRKVQRRYWEQFKHSQWPRYRVVAPAKGVDAIVECDLAGDPDFSDPHALTALIVPATSVFIDDMEKFLGSTHA